MSLEKTFTFRLSFPEKQHHKHILIGKVLAEFPYCAETFGKKKPIRVPKLFLMQFYILLELCLA